jgi:hypothetical protein
MNGDVLDFPQARTMDRTVDRCLRVWPWSTHQSEIYGKPATLFYSPKSSQ